VSSRRALTSQNVNSFSLATGPRTVPTPTSGDDPAIVHFEPGTVAAPASVAWTLAFDLGATASNGLLDADGLIYSNKLRNIEAILVHEVPLFVPDPADRPEGRSRP